MPGLGFFPYHFMLNDEVVAEINERVAALWVDQNVDS